MKKVSFIALLLISLDAFAGGDSVSGTIIALEGDASSFQMTFVQKDKYSLVRGCETYKVTLSYQRVPWFSWVPLIKTSHPSKAQTNEAIDYLRNAFNSKKKIHFGYMGGGLYPTKKSCTFLGKGFQLMKIKGIGHVLSFYTPV